MPKSDISINFFAIFMVLKLDYRNHRKIARFLAEALSFIYFPQKNTLESHISSSVLNILRKCKKITQKIKTEIWQQISLRSHFQTFSGFCNKYIGLKIKQ